MPLPTQSLASIIKRARAYFRTSFPGFPMGTKQFLGQSARALGANAWGLQKGVEDLDLDIVPQPQSSKNALATWAFTLGLPNGAGGFGPLVPSVGSGGAATLTGVQGTIYADGIIATAEDGTTEVALSGGVVIPGAGAGSGSIAAKFVAATPGTIGNLPAGTVLTWQNPPVGADPTFTLTSPISDGIDSESNDSIYGRIITRLQNPPRGGVASDYVFWVETVAGVVGIYVYPRRSGTGTVDVVITVGGSGTARVPSAALRTLVQAAVDRLRPIAAERVNVLLPFTDAGHLIRVRVVPNGAANAFDWADGGVALPIDAGGYAPGPPATMRFTGLAPTSLKNAISAYIAGTGPQPRLQVLSTGSVVNLPIGTSKTVTWTDGGGKTTITLDTVPSGWVAPAPGDSVYAYGPAVATIAAGIKAYVDGLGTSRASGYADPSFQWSDTLAISWLNAIAENAIDATGSFLINEVPVGGATIDGVVADVQAKDIVIGRGPELLFASHIAVTA